MADVELVIKIPEETYNFLKRYGTDGGIVENSVINGIPLPKGHGRLIDADAMWDIYHSNDYDFYEALDDAPTIIESDKEK